MHELLLKLLLNCDHLQSRRWFLADILHEGVAVPLRPHPAQRASAKPVLRCGSWPSHCRRPFCEIDCGNPALGSFLRLSDTVPVSSAPCRVHQAPTQCMGAHHWFWAGRFRIAQLTRCAHLGGKMEFKISSSWPSPLTTLEARAAEAPASASPSTGNGGACRSKEAGGAASAMLGNDAQGCLARPGEKGAPLLQRRRHRKRWRNLHLSV